MTRFMLTVATTALVPTLALAESHATDDTLDPGMDPAPMVQTDTAEPKPMSADKMDADKMASADYHTGLIGSAKASVIIGSPIYTLSADEQVDWDPMVKYDMVADSWTRIGSVDDFILGEDGKVTGLVAEVGGFLGMGDTLVMLPLDETRMVPVDDDGYAVVTPFTGDQLAEMENVE